MPLPIVEIRNLTRLIPNAEQPLLDRLSLSIEKADRIGLAGASGSGKTTLMRVIAGLDPTHEGTLVFEGQEVTVWPAYRRKVIYLHQRPAMIDGTVRENLKLPFTLSCSTENFLESRMIDWLKPLGKSATILDQTVDTLSGGEQQIIALLRAIQLDPVVLLLDEPTASLDAKAVASFERLVNDWCAASPDRAIVWTSHDERQLARMTNRMMAISGGKIQ